MTKITVEEYIEKYKRYIDLLIKKTPGLMPMWTGPRVILYIHDDDYRNTYARYKLKDLIESICRSGYYAKFSIIIAHKFKETEYFIEQDSYIDFLPSFCIENTFIVS